MNVPEPTRAEEHAALIAESWKRCRESYGLLDRSPRPLPAPRPDEAAVRLERLRDGSHRIFSEIARAASIVRRTGGMLVLTDPDRIVVNVIRNPADTIGADEPIALGSCWHERAAGTNGVHIRPLSTAKRLRFRLIREHASGAHTKARSELRHRAESVSRPSERQSER